MRVRFYADRMTDAHRDAGSDVAAHVSAELKTLFAEIARADIDGAAKARWQKRLIAITNASKHDVARAAEQLARCRSEWNVFYRGTDDAR